MNKRFTLLLSIMALPAFGMQRPDFATYLKAQEAVSNSYIRTSLCGLEIIVEKKGSVPMVYLLSCPQAEELLQTLSQNSDKSDYSVSYLKMKKMGGHIEEKTNISLDEAQLAIALFSASVQARITRFIEKSKQEHIQEYEQKFGPVEKK